MKHSYVLLFSAAVAICRTVIADTFTVTNTNVSGTGSLRNAILDANAHGGADTIVFAIPSAGVQTITPTFQAPLPQINSPVLIDGYTQGVAHPNTLTNGDDAVILIEISGAIVTNNGNGLIINTGGGGSMIRGLAIDRGWGIGVQIVDSSSNIIEGCFLGTDPAGAVAVGNTIGVDIEFGGAASLNLIGGTTPAARNLIAGNSTGVVIRSGTNNKVQGNFIGTDATGAAYLGVPGGSTAVDLRSNGNLVGGSSAAARNVIAGNGQGDGVVVNFDASVATGNQIQGNFLGTDVTGIHALGLGDAIRLAGSTSNTLIGGLTATVGTPPGNVIAASSRGIVVSNGVASNTIQGNLIGTDVTGTVSLGNSIDGIRIAGPSNLVGGSIANARNVISANGRHGIFMANDPASVHDNLLQGNFIGTDISGSQLLGNGADGIFVADSIANTIGGSAGAGSAPGNVIAGNGRNGVSVVQFSATTALAILGNSIFSNGGLGIDLSPSSNPDGVTPNDPCDPDTGANNLQNFPVLTAVANSGGNTSISGTLSSVANTTYRIECFANVAVDPTGFGEGQSFLGATSAMTNGSCNASFTVVVPQIPAGRQVTATATDPNGNTSEFSAAIGLQVTGAASRKMHGAASFDVNLPLTGASGIECRTGGATGDHQLIVTFAAPVTVTGNPQAQVTTGTGVVGTGGMGNGGAVSVNGSAVAVPLTNVANVQTITLTLFNVSDGVTTANVVVPMSVLLGDTTGNGIVNASDIGQTKSQSGQTLGATNFRADVNLSGSINASDIGLVKSKAGTSLPP